MQVTYTTTLDDYVAFNRHSARKSPVVKANFFLGWFVVPAIAGAVGLALAQVENLRPVALFVVVGGLFYAVSYPLVSHWWFDWYIRSYAQGLGTRGMLGRTTLILTAESLVEITETTRSEVRWKDIKGVEETGDYLFILVTGVSAAIVPRHGCEEADDFDAVREFALAQVAQKAEPDAAAVRRD